jgi:hypothetical protein
MSVLPWLFHSEVSNFLFAPYASVFRLEVWHFPIEEFKYLRPQLHGVGIVAGVISA